MTFVASVAVAAFPVQEPEDPEAFPVTFPNKAPTKEVAVKTPVSELKVKFVPDFGARFPVAAVANKTLQLVSELSSATVTAVATAEVTVKLVAERT